VQTFREYLFLWKDCEEREKVKGLKAIQVYVTCQREIDLLTNLEQLLKSSIYIGPSRFTKLGYFKKMTDFKLLTIDVVFKSLLIAHCKKKRCGKLSRCMLE
jgi:hypothetical protein